ncbi:hypothetical protein BLL42_20570 [Pseudomonas frederiksbergensis]|uniref:Uncharacterized protein n=1 Tax=Pseudomonas frederiksbergensis TaxID=104087 RepID=A0A1J0EPR3_9PSED|nr:hypothetical protein [Pseudomonas frederiksbergensis]APC18006.1 hypothetical protein BLL42_20570 [Pseudomonas frederiksbergensis]
MSKSIAVSKQNQQLHDNVQEAVKEILGATKALGTVEYAKLLTSTLAAATKTVTISIADKDFITLKNSGYKLCFAKKVGNNDFNVVWQSYDDYLSTNTFTWTPQYQLFGTNSFLAGVQVRAQTKAVNVGLGQQVVLGSTGLMGKATTGGPATAITLVNEYRPIHPGVSQLSTGINNEQISTPIYVATAPVVTGNISLTPVETILVWFEQRVETSTMFSDSRSMSIEIDMTEENDASRNYANGAWTTVKVE